ncbi:MAG: tRNA-dihydrouridine synthase family protein [Proteobacteria bacterium]|nr:tRNA-dihydrouridine synthase family protein [Pseudomonadota bacterium]
MKYYFAPLEGITSYTYRNVHHELFPGLDAYFAPFIQPKQTHVLETREKKDIDPVNNSGITLVPQIMANTADNFLWAAQELAARGYDTVNLNLGCPRATIVTRHKGSGMLADLDTLERFLDDIYNGVANNGPKISLKTRIGKDDANCAQKLISLYNKYPLPELIIHPRTQKDMYTGTPRWDVLEDCLRISKHAICLNGNIFSPADHQELTARFPTEKYPNIKAMMLGRGLIADPVLHREITQNRPVTQSELKRYHDTLFKAWDALNYGTSTLLHRTSELWFYLGCMFKDADKYVHKIRKAKNIPTYQAAVEQLFEHCEPGGYFSAP